MMSSQRQAGLLGTGKSLNPIVASVVEDYMAHMGSMFAHRFFRCMLAQIISLALMVSTLSAASIPQNVGRASVGLAGETMNLVPHHHTGGQQSSDLEHDCCEPEADAGSSCHIAPCCVSELQNMAALMRPELGCHSSGHCLERTAVRSLAVPLPERPPRLS